MCFVYVCFCIHEMNNPIEITEITTKLCGNEIQNLMLFIIHKRNCITIEKITTTITKQPINPFKTNN